MAFEIEFINCSETYKSQVNAFYIQYINGFENINLKTSGSTGAPKTISFTKEQLENSSKATIEFLGLHSELTSFICLNVNYIAGKMMLVRSIEANMKAIVVEPSLFPFDNLKADTIIDFAAFVPSQLVKIFEKNKTSDVNRLNSIKKIILGGEAISAELHAKLIDVKTEVYHTFGMTETLSHFAIKKISKDNTFYALLPGVEIDINEEKCLRIRSLVTKNLWIQTNDIVSLVKNGDEIIGFFWIGRKDNVINSGGIKINIEELEEKIGETFKEIGLSNSFFVYKAFDSIFSEIPILYIEGDNIKENKLRTIQISLEKSIENKYWIPKKIIPIEIFALTLSGKIDKINTVNSIQIQENI